MQLLILGYGYTARHFVRDHRGAFAAVMATGRDPATLAAITDAGLEPVALTGGPDESLHAALRRADAVLATAPPDAAGDPFAGAVAAACRAGAGPRVVVYLSTTGVYGDHQGRWIDESVPANPQSDRSRWRLAAEQQWQALALPSRAVAVLRLPGIYGPDRNALAQLRSGTARRIIKPGQIFNRAHVADIAQAIARCFALKANGVWNIADDEPAAAHEVIEFAASLAGVAPPPAIAADDPALPAMTRSFYAENKRISNAAAKAELRWKPRYSNYRAGLSALLADSE